MSLKKLACLLLFVLPLSLGCQPPAAPKGGDAPKTEGKTEAGTENAPAPDSNTTSQVDASTTQLVMAVEGMQCPQGCPPAVAGALKSVDGVADVRVDFEHKTATVSVDPAKFDSKKAVEALSNAGFTGTVN